MPPRPKVLQLPEEVRRELDSRLIANGFGSYAEITDWLRERGFSIGVSSVKRYGAGIAQRIENIRLATAAAESLVEAAGDTGALADASLRLIQERMWDVLVASEGDDVKELSAAARALADTARASVSVQQERRKVLKDAGQAVGAEAAKRGISPDVAQALRDVVEGRA